MSTTQAATTGMLLFGLLRRLAILGCWLIGGFLALVVALLLFVDSSAGCKVAMAIGIAGSTIATMVSAWRRRTALAREAAAMPIPTPDMPYRPSCVTCRLATRGNGQLVVDDHGDLRFLTTPDNAAKTAAYAGLDLERTSPWRLVGRKLKTICSASFRRGLLQQDRDLTIPRACLRFALPFSRFVMGPTVLVGYESPDRAGICLEEFYLSIQQHNQVRVPTADADGWARDLGTPNAPAALVAQATRRRSAMRRRMALADVALGALVSGTVFLGIATLMLALVSSTGEMGVGLTVAGIMAGIWGASMGLVAACHLYSNR